MNPAPETLVELFTRTVAEHPDRPAVSDEHLTLSYAELAARASSVAAGLQARGVGPQDRVAVALPRGTGAVAAVLGVLAAGAAVLAVDDAYPRRRQEQMLGSGAVRLLLTEQARVGRLDTGGASVAVLGDVLTGSGGQPVEVAPWDAAFVLFTSGSSGAPKAVVLEHRQVVAFAIDPVIPTIGPGDRMAQAASMSFDTFLFELWRSVAGGAQLVVMPSMVDLVGTDLHRQIRRRRITAMLAPAIVLNHLARHDREAVATLRLLCSGGDVLLAQTCRELRAGGLTGQLYNLYGPTETTVACTAHPIGDDPGALPRVPIGRALGGARLHVLDAALTPVPAGAEGELYVGGAGIGRGYLNRAADTAARFVADPFGGAGARLYATGDRVRLGADDALEFVGRIDGQVKVSGHRVEPAEVERVLYTHPGLFEVAVTGVADDDGVRLVAFVVGRAGDTTPGAMRAFVADRVPASHVPAEFVVLDAMPLDAHGKRDMISLRQLVADRSGRRRPYVAPRTETEAYLVELMEDLLRLEHLGIDDDFFGLGGHSLLAARGRMRIQRELGITLPPQALFENPVVRELAALVERAPDAGGQREVAR